MRSGDSPCLSSSLSLCTSVDSQLMSALAFKSIQMNFSLKLLHPWFSFYIQHDQTAGQVGHSITWKSYVKQLPDNNICLRTVIAFYARVTIVWGIKICPCLSVCLSVCPSVRPSVRHALRYRVCVINFSHSFQWIFLKPCISVVDILKMCMWVFGGARINFDKITAF